MKDNPCFGCEERTIGCHGKCKRHKEWQVEYEAYKEKVKSNRHNYIDLVGYERDRKRRLSHD